MGHVFNLTAVSVIKIRGFGLKKLRQVTDTNCTSHFQGLLNEKIKTCHSQLPS
jgi:hypothetical protein